MGHMDSERKELNEGRADARVPLSGVKLTLAIEAMKSPNFLLRLTARIMRLARRKGFHSPFKDDMDLPGGKSAGDLASDLIEKAMDGTYNWNHEEIPNFYHFCLSRAESILTNLLDRAKWSRSVSPLVSENAVTGQIKTNPLNTAVAPDDIYAILRLKEGGALGDRFLEDFALSLGDGSPEQSVVMAVFDDRECGNRAYCCKKLSMSGDTYDAATKRLLRRLPAFLNEWRKKNHVGDADWKEAQ